MNNPMAIQDGPTNKSYNGLYSVFRESVTTIRKMLLLHASDDR